MYELADPRETLNVMPAGLFLLTAAHEGRDNWQFVVRAIGMVPGPPALVAVGLNLRNLTSQLAEASGEFVLTVCSEAQAPVVVKSRGLTGHETEDKFAVVGLQRLPALHVKAPLLADAHACIECRIVSKHPAGNYHLYVAEVLALHYDASRPPVVHYNHLIYRFLHEPNIG
ncbi:MAG TPA: flavin reductase family protein [Chloroflexota bacterium]|nr:flavin reductase family protein [Chloroflexota bacterium]